ncbi:hypothetical protein RCL10_07170 [Staphylococcus lloydii]|uniref:hypothetical protein n=1 Tax=Staphylococcus lloydii TaxID=2781774 RepID=UPI000660CC60|nr:hypothetical protein [Staphylococcus lloydii]MDU9418284.1 hypothetical protein [Staphylococcus lloydii]
MSESLINTIRTQLYDHHDEVKAALSELNQSKSLVINGPDDQLLDRGLNISFYRGQKQTIDAVNSLLDAYNDETIFLKHYEQYAQGITEDYTNTTKTFAQMDNPEDDFATFISYLYTLKGQKLIIDAINTLVASK